MAKRCGSCGWSVAVPHAEGCAQASQKSVAVNALLNGNRVPGDWDNYRARDADSRALAQDGRREGSR